MFFDVSQFYLSSCGQYMRFIFTGSTGSNGRHRGAANQRSVGLPVLAVLPVIIFSFFSLAEAQAPLADIYRDAANTPLLTSLIVSQNGKIIREGYFHGLKAGQSVNVKSVSKSVLSAAIGIAIAEGKLKETDRISDILPAHFSSISDPVKRRLTVRDFITMTAGLESTSFDNYGAWVNSRDWIRYALQRPFECAPGACMQYSTGNSHILAVVLAKKTGMSARAYMQQKLFAPLDRKSTRLNSSHLVI